jgi:hypothetical protein
MVPVRTSSDSKDTLHSGVGNSGERPMATRKCRRQGNPQGIPTASQVTCFPPSRPEDYAIKLVPGVPETINCKVYPLTVAEQEAMKKFLEENK